ncbi:MAG: DUF2029 domain-containing protein [Phycisphaeraceae bacterium]|nr:DUF2029 domain-containing protein [Phycisphaeraceae bacterium]
MAADSRFSLLSCGMPIPASSALPPFPPALRGVLLASFSRASAFIAWWLWGIFTLVIAVRTAMHPEKNSVSACYLDACAAWWNRREIYDDEWNGFIYLPHAAIYYSPFYLLPLRVGESLNRVAVIALMAWAVWRLTRLVSQRTWNEFFFVVSAITMGIGAGNAINGQYNFPLTATLVLATCSLIEKRWWIALIWLAAAITLKPIAAPPVLLAIALYPPLWWRAPIVGAVVFLLPFLFAIGDPGYVWAEYRTFLNTVIHATIPMQRRFAEFSTVIWWFAGLNLGDSQRMIWRAFAAVVTLGLAFAALRRQGGFRGGLILWALGVSYLMLFNPRTEGLTYVMVAPAIALFGAMEFVGERSPAWRRMVGLVLLLLGVLMIFVHELMPRSGPYFEMAEGRKDLLVRPMVTLLFYCWLAWLAVADDRAKSSLPRAPLIPAVRSSPGPLR